MPSGFDSDMVQKKFDGGAVFKDNGGSHVTVDANNPYLGTHITVQVPDLRLGNPFPIHIPIGPTGNVEPPRW